jgi:hypothetical protein
MRLARFCKDLLTGRRFRVTKSNNEVSKNMQHTDAFSRAARGLDDLVKSQRRLDQTIQEMSDAKDFDEENIDDFDRAPQGVRNKRLANERWAGIQAQLAEVEAEHAAYKEHMREMLVSGRPSRIRFPGARGDSTLEPFDRERYVADEDDDLDTDFPEGRTAVRQRNASIRGALGGDSMSWRSQANRRGVGEDSYGAGKSFGFRGRGFTSIDLIKSFNTIKSRLSEAMFDGQLDPVVLMNFDAAGSESRLGFDTNSAARALALVAPGVRKAYGIPTISGNHWEEFGRTRRGA